MTGANVTSIINRRLLKVTGITVDHVRSRIYWADMGRHLIEGSSFDGTDRQVVLQEGVRMTFLKIIFQN